MTFASLSNAFLASALGVGAYMQVASYCPCIEVHRSLHAHGGNEIYDVPLWSNYWSSEAELAKVFDNFVDDQDTSPSWQSTYSLYPRGSCGHGHSVAIRAISRSCVGDHRIISEVRVPKVNNNGE